MAEARGPITPAFDHARDRAAYERVQQEAFDLRQDEIKLGEGQLSDEQVSRRVDLARIPQAMQTEQQRKNKQGSDHLIFMALLDDMRRHLAELEASMAERYEVLQQIYGDNVIDGMVDTFLTDAEKAGLETDEDKMRALADKFLNPDGTIKDEYKHLEEAKYVRDWQEAQKLRAVVAKYDDTSEPSTEDLREVHDVARSAGIAAQDNMYLQIGNVKVRDTVEQAMDEDRRVEAQFVDEGPLFPTG